MTIVIGVDPGAKNLALCKISGERILEWDVINIDPSPNGLMKGLKVIDIKRWVDGVTFVVIERQPTKNVSMKRLQHFLEMLFATYELEVMAIDAQHKLNFARSTKWFPTRNVNNWSYYERKKLSVETVKNFIETTDQTDEIKKIFNDSKKKDDLADSFLHAAAFIHVILPQIDKITCVKNIKPVAPTAENTRKGVFTQGNLKYISKNLLNSYDVFKEVGEGINGFFKSCCKHFGTCEEAYRRLGGSSKPTEEINICSN